MRSPCPWALALLLLAAACGGPSSPAVSPMGTPPAAVVPSTSPTRTLDPTKPPTLLQTAPPRPPPTRVRWAVDFFAYAPHRPLLVLFSDAPSLGYRVVDATGALVFNVPIAGSGIFGEGSCLTRREAHEDATWIALDSAAIERFVAQYRTYRVVAEGLGGGGTATLELVDSGCRSTPRYVSEAEAWAQVRTALPTVPTPRPAWLPPTIDRARVLARVVSSDPARPYYEVTYTGGTTAIMFTLGEVPAIDGSGIGTRVRGVPASLTFSQSLWNDPTSRAPRRVRWVEGPYTFAIDSTELSGDELLRVAWSLDRAGAPAPKNAVTRRALGSCVVAGASAEETVRRLLALTGRGQVDAALDCFSDEYLGEYGAATGTMWSQLPTTTVDTVRAGTPVGGRAIINGTWLFANDPGGAWGARPTRFFLIAEDDGRMRIFDIWSAPLAPPP